MKKLFLCIIALLIPCIYSNVYTKSFVNYDYIDLLLKHIGANLHVPVPDKGDMFYPHIIFSTQTEVDSLVCNKGKRCGAWAGTKWHKVFLGPYVDLDTPEGDTILYHELVHVVQFYTHGAAKTCQQWADNEVQAYMLQYKYALAKGLEMNWILKWVDEIRRRCNYNQ